MEKIVFAAFYLMGGIASWALQYGAFYRLLGKLNNTDGISIFVISMLGSVALDMMNTAKERQFTRRMIQERPAIAGIFLGNGFNLLLGILYLMIRGQFEWVDCGVIIISCFFYFKIFLPLKERYYWKWE